VPEIPNLIVPEIPNLIVPEIPNLIVPEIHNLIVPEIHNLMVPFYPLKCTGSPGEKCSYLFSGFEHCEC